MGLCTYIMDLFPTKALDQIKVTVIRFEAWAVSVVVPIHPIFNA